MMELKGKRVMVVGLGVSGRAAARFLAAREARLVLVDRAVVSLPSDFSTADVHFGEEDPRWLDGVDLLVASPGVARDSVLMREASRRGIAAIGEVELASRFITAPIVGVTGTNGKSTVTMMVGDMLKRAGRNVFVGGNLGTPVVDAVGRGFDAIVAELSSFQLETIDRFRAHVAVHLNLTDDHFERYRDLEDYGRAKARILENQTADDWAILNRDDPNVWKLQPDIKARVISFGFSSTARDALSPALNAVDFVIGDRRGRIDLARYRLPGRHNLANAMAAAAAALAMNVDAAAIEDALANFRALPHRIEFVRAWRGAKFFDDSKGTNVGAVVEALSAFDPPVILIAGGLDKGGDYEPLRRAIRNKARLAILFGAARNKMRDALAGAAEIEVVETLSAAVNRAAAGVREGDTVLLSPACSSFDQFKNYAARGEKFKGLVRAL